MVNTRKGFKLTPTDKDKRIEELEKEAEEYAEENQIYVGEYCSYNHLVKAYLVSAEPREKRIAELEQKISILLSCKNCPENKGGFICQKEYEDKCLAQKIQYIKELQEEIVELKRENRGIKTCANCDEYVIGRCCNYPNGVCHHWKLSEKYRNDDELTNAKEIIKKFLLWENDWHNKTESKYELLKQAEQFLKDSEVEK